MAEIQLIDVVKKFGKVTAVDRVRLVVKDKEFLVLLGPSGCGKTTTLRMVAGLEEVTEGEIYIGGLRVNNIPGKDRDIAMVFQNYALYPHMSVYKNMAFGLEIRKLPKEEINRRVYEAAKILGIEELLPRKPKELSGGQRQRVAMGRAIVRKPKAFLFDEPLSNLDAKLRVHMRGELVRLHEKLETTILYVTHDQIEAMTLANRIVVMEKGRILQIGEPMEIYNHPKNLFVAGFLGSPTMNLIDVHVIEQNGSLFVKGDNLLLEIPSEMRQRYLKLKEQKAVFGIRPEHIYDASIKANFPGAELLRVNIDVVEPVGSAVILLCRCGSAHITASVDPQTKAVAHTSKELILDMNRMHLFSKVTQEAF